MSTYALLQQEHCAVDHVRQLLGNVDVELVDRDLRSILLAKFGVSSRLWESDVCCLAVLACSKVTPFFSMKTRNSCVAVAWIWLLYSHVSSSIFLALSSHKRCTLVRPFVVIASEIEVKRQKCGSRTCATKC